MIIFLLFILGLTFGSFATMASHRLINGGGLFTRSACVKCKHKLKAMNLIPVVSYCLQAGKCEYCNHHISIRYPAIEIITALAFSSIGWFYHDYFQIALLCLIITTLMIIIVTDFESYIIPDEMQLSLALLGIVYAYYNHYPLLQVLILPIMTLGIGLLVRYTYKVIMHKEGLGLGDVKFFGCAGLYLPPAALSAFFFLSGIIGIVIALFWRLLGKGKKFPFGPALAIALYLCIMFPVLYNIVNNLFR